MAYYSGQGKIYLHSRDSNGNMGAGRYIGKTANGAKLGLQTTTQTRKESETGQRLTATRYITEKNATVEFQIEEWSRENIAFMLWGAEAVIAAGSVTAEALPSGLAVGDQILTAKAGISSVVVKDSAGTPATLVADTDYRVVNAASGRLEILNLGSYTQPFTVDYANAIAYNTPMFSTTPGDWWLVFEGLNTQDSDAAVTVELYKCSLDPLAELVLKAEDITTFTITGSALYDDTKAADAELGVFGRVRLAA